MLIFLITLDGQPDRLVTNVTLSIYLLVRRCITSATRSPALELTYNWDPEIYTGGRNFGHLAYRVDNIYDLCERLMAAEVTINRPPRDGNMAFVQSPDGISIELLQEGGPLAPAEPWQSMGNTGVW